MATRLRPLRTLAIAGVIGIVGLAAVRHALWAQSEVSAVLMVEPRTTYQTIVGWEATAEAAQSDPIVSAHPAYETLRDRLLDLAVDDLGINRVRLEVRSGAETRRDNWADFTAGRIDRAAWRCRRYATVNDNADPRTIDPSGFRFSELDRTVERVLLPMRDRVAANGERLFVNLNYVAFTAQICDGGQYHHDDSPEEYAEFILATFLHLRETFGVVPDSVEVILEPDNTAFWRGRQIGEAIAATGARLASHGFTPAFVAPSNTNMTRAIEYFDDMIEVPGVQGLLGEFSYHRYGGVSDASLHAIGARASRYRVRTAMLEWIGATHHELHADLEVGLNSAWSRFILGDANPETGGLYYQFDLTNPAHPVVNRVPETGFFRQYFRFVRSGATRIEVSSDRAEVDPLGFVNADGSFVVVVKSDRTAFSAIHGLPSGTYRISYTTDGLTTVEGAEMALVAGQPLNVHLPAAGVLTVAQVPPM